jgi:monoterpene epsilon-lactone hydrolase
VAGDVRVETLPVGLLATPEHDASQDRNGGPDDARDVILYLPPVGSETTAAARRTEQLARLLRTTVLAVRYRPQHPQARQDAMAAYRHAEGLGRVNVLGGRLGGTVAAALLLHLRDEGEPPPRCAVLVSAPLDLTLQANSVFMNDLADRALDIAELHRQVDAYCGTASRSDPLVSPLKGNLHGLGPVLLLAAGTDLSVDDSLAFATRAARSGVEVQMRIWPEAVDLIAASAYATGEFVRRAHARAVQVQLD